MSDVSQTVQPSGAMDPSAGGQDRKPRGLRDYLARIDVPITLTTLILAALFFFSPAQAWTSASFTGGALLEILPFLLLSVATAAFLKATGADQLVAKAFEGRQAAAIGLAAIFGALSPFCSCGVVPLVAGLLAAGVPLAPVMAFCIASPIMDPQMFILTAAGIGVEFAVVKTFAAIAMGLLAGYGTMVFANMGTLNDVLRPIAKPSCGGSACAATKPPLLWSFWTEEKRRQTFWREAGTVGWFLGRWLTFAFLLESLMMAYIPGNMVAEWLGDGNLMALPLGVVLGIPAYLNGYAAIPLIGGLIDLGMSPATGLAFMLAGSVTSIPAAIAVWTLAKPRLFGLYLAFAALGSLVSGFAYLTWLAAAG